VTKKIPSSAAGPYLLLIATTLGTLFFRLGTLPFVGADEPRYARIAEEMSQAGNWITPVLQGYPWLEKPPLYYWITIPAYRIFGVGEAAARLGPAVCALLAAMTVLWLGSKLWSRREGLLAGLILLTTIGFSAYGRSASPDMPLTAAFTISLALRAASAICGGRPVWRTGTAYACLGLAVLAKGPVAIVLAAGIVLLFWTLDERGGSLARMHVLWGLAIVAVVSLPWFWLAFRENGFSFITIFFINHNLARYVSDIHHHEQPFYYFVPVLLGLFFPWSGWLPALVPASFGAWLRNWRTWDRGTVFLACWALFPFLFFSLSDSKLPGYILPSLPPLALLLGRRLSILGQDCRKTRRVCGWASLVLAIGVALAFPFALARNFGNAWLPGVVLGLAVLLPALVAFLLILRDRLRGAILATVMQGLLLVLAVTQVGFVPLAAYQSAREIAVQALAADADREPIITFCFFHHALNYYTGYRVGENFVDVPSLLNYARRHPRFLVVTEAPRIGDLENIPELSTAILGGQGDLRLLRMESVNR
jgi:4-amino-4-deoxy-L-arabinose transferase-like glycosyltransferase